MSGLTTSLRWTTPSSRLFSATASGVPPVRAMRSTAWRNSAGAVVPRQAGQREHRVDGALAQRPAGQSMPEMRVCAENGTDRAPAGSKPAPRAPYRLLAKATIERPSGVSSARLASRTASARARSATPATGDEFVGHAVAEGDRAGLVEQQRVDVARRLDRAAGRRDHIEADEPVHAGDADGRQQAADRRRDQADEQRDQHGRPTSIVPE